MNKINKSILGGSFILLITFNIFNVLNLIYNLVMVRLLSLEDYGTLSSLIYLVIIFAVFSESIQTVISKYSATETNPGKIKNLIKKSIRKATLYSIIFFIGYIILAIFLSYFLRISYGLLVVTGLSIFTSFLVPITRGALQGMKKFTHLGINMVVEGTIKLLISILLVLAGTKVYGAIAGAIIGTIFAFLISFSSLNEVWKSKETSSETPEIYTYTKPVFLVTISIILFLSLDIILAKRFFSPELVGAYAIASTIAKILFIGTQPISRAMFPISASIKNLASSKNIIMSSLKMLLLILVPSIIIIYFFSGFIIQIYAGKVVDSASSILLYLSIAMAFLSCTNLLLLYKLSVGKTKNCSYLIAFVVIEAILLSFFSTSLVSFSIALIASSVIFLIGSILLLRE